MLASPRRSAALRLLLGFILPVTLTLAFYATQQRRLRQPVQENPAALAALQPAADLSFSLDAARAPDSKRHRVSGWVAEVAGGQRHLLQPTLLVLGPDGRGAEFRVNPRRRGEPPPRGDHGSFQGFDGFEIDLKARQLPEGRPLKLFLAVQRAGRRELLDTGATLQGPRP